MLRVISLIIGLCFFSTLSVSSSPALAWGDTLIKCKIKGVGVRNFILEDGIWSDMVWERKNNTDWKQWCPETDKQNMKIGGDMNLDVRGNKNETVSGSKTSNTTGNVIHRGARIDLNP